MKKTISILALTVLIFTGSTNVYANTLSEGEITESAIDEEVFTEADSNENTVPEEDIPEDTIPEGEAEAGVEEEVNPGDDADTEVTDEESGSESDSAEDIISESETDESNDTSDIEASDEEPTDIENPIGDPEIIPEESVNASEDFDYTVSYSALKCGTPVTFTLNATNGSGNYVYYLNDISRHDLDGLNSVMDPSKMPQYQASNTFSFTFYTSGKYRLRFYTMDKGVQPVNNLKKDITITISDASYPTSEAKAQQVVSQCLAAGCSTDYEKALWLHDWILDNCAYDHSYLYCNAEGALARGTGTCEAYHRAYCYLLYYANIPYGRIVGNYHVWTAVKMDGKWYQVDTTWDDTGLAETHGCEHHLYFGINDTITAYAHNEHSPNAGYISDSLENNYFIKSGKITTWSDRYMAEIQSNIDNGNTTFTIAVTDTYYADVLYSVCAYYYETLYWHKGNNDVTLTASYTPLTYNSGTLSFNASYSSTHTHHYDNSFEWADDYSACTFLQTCTNCDSSFEGHKIELPCDISVDTVYATCTASGSITYTASVSLPGSTEEDIKTTILPKSQNHTWGSEKIIKKATLKSNGVKTCTCTKCHTTAKLPIGYPSRIVLSSTQFVYNSCTQKPVVTVYGSDGKIISSSNYKLSFSSGRKNVGTYKVTITFKGKYTGTTTKKFKIVRSSQAITASRDVINISKEQTAKSNYSLNLNAKAKTSLTYKVSNKKYMSVSSKGKITLKKGIPAGTYTVTIKAAKSKNFNAASKTITIMVE